MLAAHARGVDVETVLKENRATKEVVQFVRAAVEAGQTGNWGADLVAYGLFAEAFVESLRNVGVFDLALPLMRRVPLHSQLVLVTTGAVGAVTPQAQAKVISKLALASDQVDEKKALAIVFASDEVTKVSAVANDLFSAELSSAVALKTDEGFLNEITSGLSPTASNGGTAIAIQQDLYALLAALTLDARSQVIIAMDPNAVKHMAIATTSTGARAFPEMGVKGGVVAGCTIVPSDAATQKMIAFDANQIAGNSGTVALDTSREATINFSDAPDSPPSTSTPYVSFWQGNLVGLKAERFWGATRLRDTAVAVVSNVIYTGNSPA